MKKFEGYSDTMGLNNKIDCNSETRRSEPFRPRSLHFETIYPCIRMRLDKNFVIVC